MGNNQSQTSAFLLQNVQKKDEKETSSIISWIEGQPVDYHLVHTYILAIYCIKCVLCIVVY